jgi:hypothetical protein
MCLSKWIGRGLWRLILAAGLVGINSPILAQSFKDLDANQFCSADKGPASKYLLARALLDQFQVPASIIDWNNTGINSEGYERAVSKIYCDRSPDANAHADICYTDSDNSNQHGQKPPTKGATNQRTLVQVFDSIIGDAAAKSSTFTIQAKGWKLQFKKTHDATLIEQRKSVLRDSDGTLSPAGQVFSEDPSFYDITCLKNKLATKPSNPPVGSDQGAPVANANDAKMAQEIIFSHFRLRGTASDLTIPQGSDAFKGASSASLAASNDGIAQKNTFDVHIAAGYVLPIIQDNGLTFNSVPYLKYDRDYVAGANTSKSSSNVNNIGAGLLEQVQISDGFYGSLTLRPDYTSSLRTNAKIGRTDLVLQPEPLWPYLGYAAPTGIPGISATAFANAIFRVGDVFEKSNDATLAMTDTFTQGGGQVGTTFFADPSSSLNGFSIPINYTYLYGFSGQYSAIPNFQAGINYAFPPDKTINVGLSVVSGRDLDTFEKQRLYKLSFGVKY